MAITTTLKTIEMKTFSIVCCIFPFLFFSCKKDTGNQWTSPRIKTVSPGPGNLTTYYYDKEGRILKAEDEKARQEFTYEPSKVIWKITELASGGVETVPCELNAAGYVFKRHNLTFIYTPEGYIKSSISTNTNGPPDINQYYYNANSGLLDSVVHMKGASWDQTVIYDFYTDKKETTGDDNFGSGFYGKSMPHPVKSATYWAPKQGIPNKEIWRTEKYSYLHDEAGRIVKASVSATSYGQGSSSTTIYTYY